MARYIDADKLLERIKDLPTWFGDGNGIYGSMLKYHNVVSSIENTPTADVVPKSEVERLRFNLEAVLEEIPETKREVAREIFEEIEKHTQEKKKAISMFKDGEDDFYDGEIHALDVFEHFLAELKKKYTESEGKDFERLKKKYIGTEGTNV